MGMRPEYQWVIIAYWIVMIILFAVGGSSLFFSYVLRTTPYHLLLVIVGVLALAFGSLMLYHDLKYL